MHRTRVHGIGLAAALATGIACVPAPGSLQGVAGGRGDGAPGGATSIVGAGGAIGPSCGAYTVPSPMTSLDVVILLDASGSMNDDASGTPCDGGCGADSKWAQATAAIDAVVAQTEMSVSWGLELFGDLAGDVCGVSNTVSVPVQRGGANAIAAAIAGRTSANGGLVGGGSTPTRRAVSAAVAYLPTIPNDNRKLILLATDGAPDCMPGNSDRLADDSAGAVAAIGGAAQQGFPTFAVGIATAGGPADATLDQMARAGSVPRAGSPAYYPASSTSELIAVLDDMITGASRCVFALPAPPTADGTHTPAEISVSLDGAPIPHDTAHANGWDYGDPGYSHIQLYGTACDAVTSDPTAHTVTVAFLCLID